MTWHTDSLDRVLSQLSVDPDAGLDTAEAERRHAETGPNQLVERGVKSRWAILLDQFKDAMVIILLVAAAISLALGEFLDAIVILIIVIVNAIIGFTQEYRAEQAMEALKKMAVPTVRVRRNGGHIEEIPSPALVPGDIVLLEAGNLIPADGRVVESVNLKVEEAALTGESEPVNKKAVALDDANLQVGDRINMLYMGTVVTYGRGSFVVTETGMTTELGKIAEMIQDVEQEQTPLQRRLTQLGKMLALAAMAIIAVVIVLGYIDGRRAGHVDWEILFLTGVSMAVAAIPESLPAVVTITLALGAQRLLKRHALMRRLPAVETLGSVTVICSDKTGTLTENRMTVTLLDVAGNTEEMETLQERKGRLRGARLINDASPTLAALSVLIRAGALCNDAVLERDNEGNTRAIGDPTEAALVLAAEQLGWEIKDLRAEWPRVGEVPFTSERKRMTTIHHMSHEVRESDSPIGEAPYIFYTKGAVDSLLDIASGVLVDKEVVPLDDAVRDRILETNAEFARSGQRVLGVSLRLWYDDELPEDPDAIEHDETFIGMVAMMDPPRPEVEDAVRVARQAGIRPIMITGDHPLTAVRIGQDLHITENEKFVRGSELAGMSQDQIKGAVDDVSIFARVAPEHKLNIVEALQDDGEIVAMTGDGVNDAPALKRADIGVAMGITGTDVSKQAADMVLLDDNFATIVAAVEEGRVIFDNIRKFIKYTLSSNTGELFVMLVGPLLGMPLPLLPLQILWINLVTDGLPGLALAVEPGERGVMTRAPYRPTESVFSRGIGYEILWIGALMGLVSLLLGYGYWRMDPDGPWQTMVFTTLTLAQMGNALATRASRDSLFTIGVFSNRLMVYAVLLTFGLQILLIYVPFLQRIFRTEALSLRNLVIALAASLIVFIVTEIYKWVRRRMEE
ncbi:MAG: cation-translocating P-type ATPase [Caldilineaceae bacterium]|nr:cation-translocating P-type ATPase [Caldilineaceae bacterium]